MIQRNQRRTGIHGQGALTPLCPGPTRKGLDGEVFVALKKLYDFVFDMRRDVEVPNTVVDEKSAVRRYLAYLSVLVQIGLDEMALSALHSSDNAVLMKQRLLVEWAAKGQYFNEHPDYALYMMTIHCAQSVVGKLEQDPCSSAEILANRRADLEEKKARFAHVAHLRRLSFQNLMQQLGADRDYPWLYGAPSALLHGDPEGIEHLMPVDDQGRQSVNITFPDAQLNAMMVDAGANSIMFCAAFVACFHPNNTQLMARLDQLTKLFKELVLKHPYGRDKDVVEAFRSELDETAGKPL